MAILTHNRDDFAKLAHEYLAVGQSHCGIIIAVRRVPQEIARRLLVIMDDVTAEEMDKQVCDIRERLGGAADVATNSTTISFPSSRAAVCSAAWTVSVDCGEITQVGWVYSPAF